MSSGRTGIGFVAAVALCVVALSLGSWADSRARIVRLSYVDGTVEMDRHDGRGFSTAYLNMPVIHGARVWTRDDSRAEIEFEDGSTVRMTPNTILEFTELGLRTNGDKVSVLDLQEGLVYFKLRDDGDDDFRIMAAGQQLTVDKSSHFRVQLTRTDLDLTVFNGRVDVLSRSGQRVEVRKKESLSFDLAETDRYYLARGEREGPYDQWDREREEYRNREVRYASGYRDGYRAGIYDLDYYGDYVVVPSYGRVWRPRSVGFGWDPYSDGAWVFYGSYGYMWVSYYPWGWAPYRYGSWIHVRSHGWCWRPGDRRHHNSWSNVTVVNAPTGYVKHVPPTRPPILLANQETGVVVPVGRGPRSGRDLKDMGGAGPVNVADDDGFGRNTRPRKDSLSSGGEPGNGVITNRTVEMDRNRRPQRTSDGDIPASDASAGASANRDRFSEQESVKRAGRGSLKSSDSGNDPSPASGSGAVRTERIERTERPVPDRVAPAPQNTPPMRMERPARDETPPQRVEPLPQRYEPPQRVEPAPQRYEPPQKAEPRRTEAPPQHSYYERAPRQERSRGFAASPRISAPASRAHAPSAPARQSAPAASGGGMGRTSRTARPR